MTDFDVLIAYFSHARVSLVSFESVDTASEILSDNASPGIDAIAKTKGAQAVLIVTKALKAAGAKARHATALTPEEMDGAPNESTLIAAPVLEAARASAYTKVAVLVAAFTMDMIVADFRVAAAAEGEIFIGGGLHLTVRKRAQKDFFLLLFVALCFGFFLLCFSFRRALVFFLCFTCFVAAAFFPRLDRNVLAAFGVALFIAAFRARVLDGTDEGAVVDVLVAVSLSFFFFEEGEKKVSLLKKRAEPCLILASI